jgi:outer membrane protein with beta-barrel domain
MRSTSLTFAVVGALAALPGRADAQRLSLRPQIGIYVPTADLVTLSQTGDVAKLQAGPSFGAALGLRFGSHLGIELTGTYVPTTFSQGTGGSFAKQDAKLFLGNAQVVFHVLPPSSMLSLFVSGGAGVVSHGGVAFTSQAKTSDISGVAGAGAGIRIGGINLVAGADLFRYTTSYTGTQQTTSEVKQLDVQLRLGLGFGMGAR